MNSLLRASKAMHVSLEQAPPLADLVERALRGEEITIDDHGTPVVRLTAASAPAKGKRTFGCAKGIVLSMADDFAAPVDDFGDL